ncbi:MAG: BA14K family protein [Bradyrhizobium sp.]|nr:BA14K family protein [Bradyrhizobium sp.]
MTSLKVLSAAAVMALMLPLAAPTESSAQNIGARAGGGGGGGAAVGGGGRGGGGGMAIGGGGGMRAGGGAAIGGGGFGGGGGVGVTPGGGRSFTGGAIGGGGPRYGGAIGTGGPRYSGGGHWQGRHGYRHHRRYGGFGTGLIIGGALGSSYGYYGAPYGYGYYDDGYYEEPLVAIAPDGDAIEYCKRRFKSYDVRSGTYLGYDGLRHACP